MATALVEPDTDPKQLNEVRYFLCWLYWEAEDFYRAAVLGEFLARRFPDHPAASSAAKISMAAFEQLYNRAVASGGGKENTDFEARRMAEMADFIVRRWPGTPDADIAFGVLVSYAIRNDQIGQAEKLLAEASAESRPRLELQLGNAMWSRYLDLAQPGRSADAAALGKIKQTAEKYLRSGRKAEQDADEVSDAAATGALYLAQILLSDGKYDEAIELLEDKKSGPLTLASSNHRVASRAAYVVEAYKAALRAYVSANPPQEKKTLQTLEKLEAAVQDASNGRAAEEQLTRIYIGMGVGLQKQIDALRQSGQEQQAELVATAFGQFLDRIQARQDTLNWPTRVWLAQTYYQMGDGEAVNRLPPGAKPLTRQSRDYLLKARDAYRKLLDEAAQDPKLAPKETSLLAARMQLAECYRALGQYKEASEAIVSILKEKEASLVAQRAAAYAYQGRGQEDARYLEQAIYGGDRAPSGQNVVWGWLKISQVTGRTGKDNQQFRDAFFEARLNIARCRYLIAMKNSGDKKTEDLAKAKQNVQSLAQLYPDLGGDAWRGEFDALLKQIQKAGGEKPTGLAEFPTKSGSSG
jgi:tetratricopeptide (TPR) repeat protein